MSALLDARFDTKFIASREPYSREGGVSNVGSWSYRRATGNWRASLCIPHIADGAPYDVGLGGTAVCDDFGVLRFVGSLS